MEDWYLLKYERHAPAWNMACDEWLLQNAQLFGLPILRIYGWDRPSISIGYFQAYPKSFHSHYSVVRRPTGGALVVHDIDLTFSVVLAPQHPWLQLAIYDRYAIVHERIKKVFEQRGVKASLVNPPEKMVGTTVPVVRPVATVEQGCSTLPKIEGFCFSKNSRYDVLIGTEKVAGSAQRVTKEGLLHQGSIQSKNHQKVSADELRRAWESQGVSFQSLRLADEQETAISQLAEGKFNSHDWNHRKA